MKQEEGIRTPNCGLFGNSKRKRARTTARSTPGNNRGRAAKLVSYCPVCPALAAKPENTPRMVVSRKVKVGRCKADHYWVVGGDSLPGGVSRILERT